MDERTTILIYEYPFVENNPMFAIGYCGNCGYDIGCGNWKYCPNCGFYFTKIISAGCGTCKHRCKDYEKKSCEDYSIKLDSV